MIDLCVLDLSRNCTQCCECCMHEAQLCNDCGNCLEKAMCRLTPDVICEDCGNCVEDIPPLH